MAKILTKKDEYGYPYYVCSVCFNEIESKQEAFCDECEEKFNEREDDLTSCQVVNLQEDSNFKFCQMRIEQKILFSNTILINFCESEFYVFPKQINFWENKIIELDLNRFGRLAIDGYTIRFNENQFTEEDINKIKKYRFL